MSNSTVVLSESQAFAVGQAEPVVGRRLPVGVGPQALPVGLSTAHISPYTYNVLRIENSSVTAKADGVQPGLTMTPDGVLHSVGSSVALRDFPMVDAAGVIDLPTDIAPVYVPQFEGSVEIWAGGTLVKAKRPPRHPLRVGADRKGGGLRGAISGFSKGSRRRLMLTLGKIKQAILPTFVTLTYPADWPSSPREWKRHLDVFQKRLRRRFPQCSGIWKLEPQRRGAPHFHLLIWSADFVQLLRWCSQAWYEVVDSGDEKHLRAGVRVESIRSWRGVKSYAAKYLGKVVTRADESDDNPWAFPGRWWGMFGVNSIPWAEKITALLPRAEAIILIRTMRKYAKLGGRDLSSLSILVNDATWWFQNLNRLVCWS